MVRIRKCCQGIDWGNSQHLVLTIELIIFHMLTIEGDWKKIQTLKVLERLRVFI